MKEKAIALGLSVLAVFAPIKASIITVGVLMAVDLVTGVMAARKKGVPLTSAGLRRTVTKAFVYEAALMLGYLTEQYLAAGIMPIAKLVSAMIGLTELQSIYENLNVISDSNVLKTMITKLGSSNDKPSPPESKQ